MKKHRMIKGSITTYVIIMFGLVSVCYLMGFNNMWTSWNATEKVGNYDGVDSSITQPGAANGLLQPVRVAGIEVNPIYLIIAGVFGLQFIIAKLTGASGAITFIIPLSLLILVANIFVFPVVPMTEKMSWIPDTIPLVVILIAFFNLWLILGIIEWVRG